MEAVAAWFTNFHGVGIGSLSKILAVKVAAFLAFNKDLSGRIQNSRIFRLSWHSLRSHLEVNMQTFGSHQDAVRQSSGRRQSVLRLPWQSSMSHWYVVIRQTSGFHKDVIRQSSGNYQTVINESSDRYQSVAKQLMSILKESSGSHQVLDVR